MDPKNRKPTDLEDTKLDHDIVDDDDSIKGDVSKDKLGREWDSEVKGDEGDDFESQRDTDLDVNKGGSIKSDIDAGDKYNK